MSDVSGVGPLSVKQVTVPWTSFYRDLSLS